MTEQLRRISELAEQIAYEAEVLDTVHRLQITDVTTLIRWIAFEAKNPSDPEALEKIEALRTEIGIHQPPPVPVLGRQTGFLLFLGMASIAGALFATAGYPLGGTAIVAVLTMITVHRSKP